MKAVIIAGGKGTRLGLKDIPKPMVHIGGIPLLEHQINNAKGFGIKDIYMLCSHLSETIKYYFGNGNAFGVTISYIVEEEPLGTAGAITQLEDRLDERFIVFYGDVFLEMDLRSFIEFDEKAYSLATIVVHPNDHPFDSDLVEINDENRVLAFHSKQRQGDGYYRNLVNAAIYILDPEIFRYIPKGRPSDLGKDVFPLVLRSGEVIRAYKTAEYIKDIGTPERLKEVTRDFSDGKIKALSKRNKRVGIFLDRDGTLIKEVNLLHKIEDVELFPFSAQAIKKINESGHPCFLVTNQSVIARNLCSILTVKEIHKKIETLLGRERAYLNDIYFCPHHPDKGYPGENSFFKIDCECRKPKVGLIRKAADEYNVDVEDSWFIGDGTTDIQTGINAGLKTILVRTGKGGKDGTYQCIPDFEFDNLETAIDFILEEKQKYHLYLSQIISYIEEKKNRLPFIISIGGLARSGKTTFVKLLVQALQEHDISTQVLPLDHWLLGANERKEYMNVRERYSYDEAKRDLRRLINREEILLKTYDSYSRTITGEEQFSLDDSGCLIIEGVPSLDMDGIRDKADLRVYIEIDEDIRKKRFFSFYQWKDLSAEEIETLYQKRLKDEVPFIEESRKYADIVVRVS